MFARKFLFLSLAVFCFITLSFSELDRPGLSFDSGPTATCNMSGTYTQIKTLDLSSGQYNFSWSPPLPDNKAIYVGYEAQASGYGWVNATIYYSFSGVSEGSQPITQMQVGTLGGNVTAIGVKPDGRISENVNISRSIHAATANETYGFYTWNVLGSTDPENRKSFVKLQAVAPKWRYNIGIQGGGSWVWEAWGDPNIQDFSGSGTWNLTGKFACPKCKEVGVPYPAYHKYMSCTTSITQNGSTIYCQAGSNVWKCQSHTHDFSSGSTNPGNNNPGPGSTPPTGDAGGTTGNITYACGDHSGPSSGSSGHAAASCGTSGHYICDGADHSLQASCTSMDTNGNSCTVTNFYACDGHTHVYPEPPPPPTVSCGRSACTETVSSTNEHRVGPCSACGKSYWSCGEYGSYHENRCRERTCRYGGCGNKWRRCQSDTPYCSNNPDRRCWAR